MSHQDTWKFYRDRSKHKDWRWQRKAANGDIGRFDRGLPQPPGLYGQRDSQRLLL